MVKSDNDKNEYIYDLLTQDSYFILNRKLNSAVELSYERIILENKGRGDISSLLNVSEATLSTLTFRDLRFICKKFKISYNGKNTKEEIIEKKKSL